MFPISATLLSSSQTDLIPLDLPQQQQVTVAGKVKVRGQGMPAGTTKSLMNRSLMCLPGHTVGTFLISLCIFHTRSCIQTWWGRQSLKLDFRGQRWRVQGTCIPTQETGYMLITHSTFEWANRCTDNLVDVCYFRNAWKPQKMWGGSEGFMSSKRRFWFEEGPWLWEQQAFFDLSDGWLEPGLAVRETEKRQRSWVQLFTPWCEFFLTHKPTVCRVYNSDLNPHHKPQVFIILMQWTFLSHFPSPWISSPFEVFTQHFFHIHSSRPNHYAILPAQQKKTKPTM